MLREFFRRRTSLWRRGRRQFLGAFGGFGEQDYAAGKDFHVAAEYCGIIYLAV